MDWRLKALLQQVLSRVPGGADLNHLMQRHVTHSQPIDDATFLLRLDAAESYLQAFHRHSPIPLDQAVFFELGAGADLAVPLIFYALGVNRQILVDVYPLARPSLIRSNTLKLQAAETRPSLPRRPVEFTAGRAALKESLLLNYGIQYLAPADARATTVPSQSVDIITSTNTLEHIPPDDIRPILEECWRLLVPRGLMMLQIDYKDHFSYVDSSITPYNYLRYSEATWRLLSPPLMHQNRLRHSQYMGLVDESRWELLQEHKIGGSPEDLRTLGQVPLNKSFRDMDPADVAVQRSFLVLRRIENKAAAASPARTETAAFG